MENVINQLKQQGYIDDFAFARYWTENRVAFSPRSKAMIRQELARKGIDADTIGNTVEGIDDADNACRAAQKKERAFASLDYDRFKQRMYEYLRTLGFNYETISYATEHLWQEWHNSVE